MVDDLKNKTMFIIRYGKISKPAKMLLDSIRCIFKPATNNKYSGTNKYDGELYKQIAILSDISMLITLRETKTAIQIKIGNVMKNMTVYFRITNFDKHIHQTNYKSSALITFSGFDNDDPMRTIFDDQLFESTDAIERVISFSKINDLVYVRHYKLTRKEGKCIKVGLKEIGPKIAMKYIKIENRCTFDKW